MRSAVTAGLTPQQLLDRRRAQNKLAQRRFREKAKQVGASASNSVSPTSTPPQEAREISVDTRDSFASHGEPDTRDSFASHSDLSLRAYSLPSRDYSGSSSSSISYSSTPVNSTFQQPLFFKWDPSCANVATNDVMRADPYLMSLPLPSPSLFASIFTFTPTEERRQSLKVDQPCPSPRCKSAEVTPPLSASLSDSSAEPASSVEPETGSRNLTVPRVSMTPAPPRSGSNEESCTVLFSSLSYGRALRQMIRSAPADDIALWQHLKALPLPDMSTNMRPTSEQLHYPHHRCIALLPWPSVRARVLSLAMSNRICQQELLLDLLLSIMGQKPSFLIYGDDPFDPESWEVSQSFASKWGGLFDEAVLRRSNWWRRQRGLPDLSLPENTFFTNSYMRQRLGTGSIYESSQLWSATYPPLVSLL